MSIIRRLGRRGGRGVGNSLARKNLLIGNGVNQCSDTGKDWFSTPAIKERFVAKLDSQIPAIEFEDIRASIASALYVIRLEEPTGIELLAARVYEHVRQEISKTAGYFSGNNEQRMKRILKRAAIQAIFLGLEGFQEIEIWKETVEALSRYGRVFTLNYYEYWDESGRCIFLHNGIIRTNTGEGITGEDKCIFSPLLERDKGNSDALYPSEHLYPAEDLALGGEYELYEALKGLGELDVFGVSPEGDRELLRVIGGILQVRTFIHNKDSNSKTLEIWNRVVGHARYLDAKDFTNARHL